LIYFHGRDNRFRPIVVLEAQKFNSLKMETEEIKISMTYFIEHMLRHCLLPGQVENWIMVTDLTGIGVTNLPTTVREKFLRQF
jgi:hypothetical protein